MQYSLFYHLPQQILFRDLDENMFRFSVRLRLIFALKTAKNGVRWKLFFFPFLAKSKKLLIWAGKHLTTTVNFDEQEAIRNAKKPDDYWLFWTSVNMYDNCSIVLLRGRPGVRIPFGAPDNNAESLCFQGFSAFLYEKARKNSFTVWDKILLKNLIFDNPSGIGRLLSQIKLNIVIYIERLFTPHWGWIGVVPRAAFGLPLRMEVVFQKPMWYNL